MAWACCGMRGWRQNMEDTSLMLPNGYLSGDWRDWALFGVFDGHGGEQVARFAVRRLPQVLAELPGQDAEVALREAFLRLDDMLRQSSVGNELRELTLPGNEPQDSAETCGTTAVCCFIQGNEMILSHVGDSRAVLCRQGAAVALTADHKPELPEETARIEAAGGFVQEGATAMGSGKEYRVNGGLNLSRALGDLRYKSDPKLKPAEQLVSAIPDTSRLQWQQGVDEFVLLASDGVWECMTNQQAVNFVRARLPPPGSKKGLQKALGELLDMCCASTPAQRGGLGCDNMTAVLVRFEVPCSWKTCSPKSSGLSGKWYIKSQGCFCSPSHGPAALLAAVTLP
ncbi:unnamed protein product [Symbiodinium pilosum]|uniref:PPM-type phosphatase domain-containing protein n=1 Tax=Symbiodinium pilosum TaxID=2952 RepID=A0A812N8Y4_SYMPI|nr:unnamed protein product [Symbiodinium pilosum]